MRGDSSVAGEGRVVGTPKFHSWGTGKCTMPLTNINSDLMRWTSTLPTWQLKVSIWGLRLHDEKAPNEPCTDSLRSLQSNFSAPIFLTTQDIMNSAILPGICNSYSTVPGIYGSKQTM